MDLLVNRPNIGKHVLRPNVWSEQVTHVELAGDLFETYCWRTLPKSDQGIDDGIG